MESASPAASSSDRVGVLVVDDHRLFRQVAREVIEATAHFELLGEASSGEDALAVVPELDPDLVLLDVRMPGMDGIETAARLRSCCPASVVVLISVEEAANLPSSAASCGAAEVVRKQDFGPALLRRLWKTHHPEAGLAPTRGERYRRLGGKGQSPR
jgi:two-component system, NarL family, invasion response regulator UvrY